MGETKPNQHIPFADNTKLLILARLMRDEPMATIAPLGVRPDVDLSVFSGFGRMIAEHLINSTHHSSDGDTVADEEAKRCARVYWGMVKPATEEEPPYPTTPISIREACEPWVAEEYGDEQDRYFKQDEIAGAERGFDAGASWAMSTMVEYIKASGATWNGHPIDLFEELVRELRREFKLDE